MGVPIESLNRDQKFWYAKMIVGAVLADGEISRPETEFVKQVAELVNDASEKQTLLSYIASKKMPPLEKPQGISNYMLAAIYLELSQIMISDAEFTDSEREFMGDVAKLFHFTEKYIKALMKWCEEGLAWQLAKKELLPEEGEREVLRVPLEQLDAEQKKWYAKTLISSIMCDGQLDREEVGFLKMAISFVKAPSAKNELKAYISNHIPPPMTPPPAIPRHILVRIFMETIMIISADENIDYHEKLYLQRLSDLCRFPKELFNRLINWCEQGINWKLGKNALIEHCEVETEKKEPEDDKWVFSKDEEKKEDPPDLVIKQKVDKNEKQTFSKEEVDHNIPDLTIKQESDNGKQTFSKEETAQPPQDISVKQETNKEKQTFSKKETSTSQEDRWEGEEGVYDPFGDPIPEMEENSENNSITDYNMECFLCNSIDKMKFFYIKPESYHPSHNIFGIPTFRRSKEGFDYIDYNRCKVAVCPNCLFASTQKNLFRQNQETALPEKLIHKNASPLWLKEVDKRKAEVEEIQELSTINRSIVAVVKSYQLAVKSMLLLAKLNKSIEQTWHCITLKLTLAEVLINNGKREQAEGLLRKIQKQVTELFQNQKNSFIAFRSGRLLFLIATYFNESQQAEKYHDYFQTIRENQVDQLPESELTLFKRIYGEIKRIYDDPMRYSKEYLNGFHLIRD